jgi:hypothetical protein
MIEHQYPIREKLPPSITACDYAHAWARLRLFVGESFDKTNLTFRDLCVNTSSVGEDLALAIRGGGTIVKEVRPQLNADGRVQMFENWRKVVEVYSGREKTEADLIPEENQIYILKSYTEDSDDGFVLRVPIKTSEYSILTPDINCPSFAFIQDQEIMHPSSTASFYVNTQYAILLEEAVTDIVKALPYPAYFKDLNKKRG